MKGPRQDLALVSKPSAHLEAVQSALGVDGGAVADVQVRQSSQR